MNISERRRLIIDALKEKDCTNKELEAIIKKNGHKFSTSGLSRDIFNLKQNGFHIHRPKKGLYSLSLINEHQFTLTRFLKHLNQSQLLKKIIAEKKQGFHQWISDNQPVELDYSLLEDIITAIWNKQKISFKHQSYYKKRDLKSYTISPYLIKEFKGRFYLVGSSEEKLRTFSIDRISNLQTSNSKFNVNLDYILEKINSTYGVSFSDQKPKLIKLKFCLSQKRYLESLPLHETQEILEQNDSYFILKLFLAPSIELKQEILKYGNLVEVIQPLTFRTDLHETLKDTLKMYDTAIS